MKIKIRSRWLTRWISWLAVRTSQMLFATCRKVYLAPEPWLQLNHIAAPDDDRRGILCVWHDELLLPTLGAAAPVRRQACCLVSKHQDGSYLAEAMGFLEYATVRGSTSRGGASAVKQLLEDTAGKHIIITPDGPRGPRHQMKVGAVFVASQTGRVICPGAYACRHCWRYPGSWTDMVIPKPFTTIYYVTGTPIHVPPNISRDDLERYIDLMQQAMDHLGDQLAQLLRGEIREIVFRDWNPQPAQAAA